MKIGIDYTGIATPFYCNDGMGNFLLHKRSKNCRDEEGCWDTGGGRLEFGLTLEQNVMKEVREEYGCEGKIQERLPARDIFREEGGIRTHWVAAPFFIKVDPAEVRINEPEKIDELGWFKLDALPEPLHKGFQFGLKTFSKYFDKYS